MIAKPSYRYLKVQYRAGAISLKQERMVVLLTVLIISSFPTRGSGVPTVEPGELPMLFSYVADNLVPTPRNFYSAPLPNFNWRCFCA